MILAISITVTSFAIWINLIPVLNLIPVQIWLIEIVFLIAIVVVLAKKFKSFKWKIPIIVIVLDLIYHLYSSIHLYYLLNPIEPIYHTTFFKSFQYTFGGDNGMVVMWIEIPFVILTILFTIGFYIFGRIKSEMDID